jgi:hypothetical protein
MTESKQKTPKGFAKLTNMLRKNPYLQKYLVLLITILSIMVSQTNAQELETPLITNVQVSPDQKQIVIKGDKPLGIHSAFAFENPYRLVIDFENTGLGKVPAKIKVDKPPINEIRLGANARRARLVVDFGEYPVPPFMVERKGNLAVVALGNVPTDPRMIQRSSSAESSSKPYHATGPKAQRRITPKKETTHLPSSPIPVDHPTISSVAPGTKTGQPGFLVKQSLVTNNMLLVELQNSRNPSETYRIVLDLNLDDMTVHNASISNSSGIVKKFDLVDSGPKVVQDYAGQEQTVNGPANAGPRKKSKLVVEQKPFGRTKYSWGSTNSSPPEVDSANQQSVSSNPFRLQKFELKSKNSGTAKLDE